MLRQKRERVRSGILRVPKRDWPKHEAWVRKHECAIARTAPGTCEGRIEFAHLRTAANSGKGQKPHSWYGIPLCAGHHKCAHDHGHETMAKRFGTTLAALFALAAEFARDSTDTAMRAAMKEHEREST